MDIDHSEMYLSTNEARALALALLAAANSAEGRVEFLQAEPGERRPVPPGR